MSSRKDIMTNKFDKEGNTSIGKVVYVDSENVLAQLTTENFDSVHVGAMVGIYTSFGGVYIIGTVSKITSQFDESEDNDKISSNQFKLNIVGTFYEKIGEKNNILRKGVSIYPRLNDVVFAFSQLNLTLLMTSSSSNVSAEKQLDIGSFSINDTSRAVLDGNKFFQKHAAIVGSTGSGKSWTVATLLEKASKLNYDNIIVFDIHGEYYPLAEGKEKIADKLSLGRDSDFQLPYWLLNRSELLSMFVDHGDNDAPNQISRFTKHILDLKKQSIKCDEFNDITVDSPIPFNIKNVVELLKKDDEDMIPTSGSRTKKGIWNGKLTRFISRLETKMNDARYGFMFNPKEETMEPSWLLEFYSSLLSNNIERKGIKIIDLSEVPSDILPTVTGTLARLLFDFQSWTLSSDRTPVAILADEAHLYIPQNGNSSEKQATRNFERISKEGRKYGMSLVIVSQRPSEVNATVLSQASNFVVLRLNNESDKNRIKNLLPDNMNDTLSQLPLLELGEAIIIGDSIILPNKIKIDTPTLKPDSNTIAFWDDWETKAVTNNHLSRTIKNILSQSFLP
ncbi:ATP-binding protein [Leuconostoc koreense]|nr:ATP-binding protein [Leuconostoc mesenteroides]QGM25776.1 DUF87 domain-containing protein [Leuconostoc mesenteroides subsp. mesenteroides]